MSAQLTVGLQKSKRDELLRRSETGPLCFAKSWVTFFTVSLKVLPERIPAPKEIVQLQTFFEPP
jgi:hypothetical protein